MLRQARSKKRILNVSHEMKNIDGGLKSWWIKKWKFNDHILFHLKFLEIYFNFSHSIRYIAYETALTFKRP